MRSRSSIPPCSRHRLLRLIMGSGEHFTLAGDIEEIYLHVVKEGGRWKGALWFWGQVLRFFPAYLKNSIYWRAMMLLNNLKTAIRFFMRKKQFTLINIFGLAVGLAGCLLIAGYLLHELSFESMHSRKDLIYRVNSKIKFGGGTINNAGVAAPFGPAAKDFIPEVEEAVRFGIKQDVAVQVGDKNFKEQRILYSDPQVFKVFDFSLLRGAAGKALEAPFSVIISRTLSQKYFGGSDPIGETIRMKLGQYHDFQVTGILDDIPSNTVLQCEILASFSTFLRLEEEALNKWSGFGMIYTFLLLREEASPKAVEEKFLTLVKTHLGDEAEKTSFYLQPLKKIYLQTASNHMSNDLNYSGSVSRLYVFSAIAVLILVIACINFINLSTAKVSQRMKEVGVRKICGANRAGLIKQFLSESVLLTTLAMALGLFFFQLFKVPFSHFIGRNLSIEVFSSPQLIAMVVFLVILVGFLAGSYPAFLLSRFPVSVVLRSGHSTAASQSVLRRILVVFQFFVAIGLIAATLTIFKQTRFAESKDLGYNRNNLVLLKIDDSADFNNLAALKNEILSRSRALSASLMYQFPAGQNRFVATYRSEAQQDNENSIVQLIMTDHSLLPTLEMELLEGRNFDESMSTDEKAVIINQTAVKTFELENPISHRFFQDDQAYQVIGVVKDFHTNSFHSRIMPVFIHLSTSNCFTLVVKLSNGLETETLAQIGEIWALTFPHLPFEYTYAEDLVRQAYDGEKRLAGILSFFCGLAILIACLGIFTLASQSAEQRTKEIGIRKVLGASVLTIIGLLSKSFTWWVLLANLLAWPAAYYIIHKWLQNFAYRTTIGIGPFFFAGVSALVIALISISFQTIKAALANPVESLRYE